MRRLRRALALLVGVESMMGCSSILGIDGEFTVDDSSASASVASSSSAGTSGSTSTSTTGASGGGGSGGSACSDGQKDGAETDVDCGGPCPACAIGKLCVANSDCASGACTGACVSDFIFQVVRVSNGGAALSGAATPVFIDAFKLDGTLVGTVELPTAASGANRALTLSGTAISEGNLSRSANGSYVTLVGYDTGTNTFPITTSASANINRVVGRIDAHGKVDTTTRIPAGLSGGNPRSATSSTGGEFWVSGTGSASSGGVWYTTLGAVGGEVRVLSNPSNVRFDHIFDGQLYATASTSSFVSVFAVGAGLPIVAAKGDPLPGLPTNTGPSPDSFVFFDRNPAIAGPDLLYIADDHLVSSSGGIQKWTFDGASWTLAGTLTGGDNKGYRGLAGVISGTGVTLVATTAEVENSVVVFVDDAPMMVKVISTAAANTAYRGVALAPE